MEKPPALCYRQSEWNFDLPCVCATSDKPGPASIASIQHGGRLVSRDRGILLMELEEDKQVMLHIYQVIF